MTSRVMATTYFHNSQLKNNASKHFLQTRAWYSKNFWAEPCKLHYQSCTPPPPAPCAPRAPTSDQRLVCGYLSLFVLLSYDFSVRLPSMSMAMHNLPPLFEFRIRKFFVFSFYGWLDELNGLQRPLVIGVTVFWFLKANMLRVIALEGLALNIGAV